MMTAMHFRHELSYDATPDEVFEMLADKAFREKVSAAQEVVSAEIAIDRTGDGFNLTNDQVQRTGGLPSFAQKFTGETTRAIQVEEWPDRHGGSVRIDAPGKPSSIQGTIALLAEGAGATEVVELDVKVKVPLIGGKLESLLTDTIRKGLEVEQTVGQAWLRGER